MEQVQPSKFTMLTVLTRVIAIAPWKKSTTARWNVGSHGVEDGGSEGLSRNCLVKGQFRAMVLGA
jgi:hypothetical protein